MILGFFFIYVDDMLMIRNNTLLIEYVIDKPHSTFSFKDLRVVNYFLSIQVVRTSNTLYFTQSKYIFELLKKVKFHETRSYDTLMQQGKVLSKYDGEILEDSTQYITIIRAL